MSNLVWETKTGERIKIKNMSDSHILNTIRYLEREKMTADGKFIGYCRVSYWDTDTIVVDYELRYDYQLKSKYKAMRREAKRRGLISYDNEKSK